MSDLDLDALQEQLAAVPDDIPFGCPQLWVAAHVAAVAARTAVPALIDRVRQQDAELLAARAEITNLRGGDATEKEPLGTVRSTKHDPGPDDGPRAGMPVQRLTTVRLASICETAEHAKSALMEPAWYWDAALDLRDLRAAWPAQQPASRNVRAETLRKVEELLQKEMNVNAYANHGIYRALEIVRALITTPPERAAPWTARAIEVIESLVHGWEQSAFVEIDVTARRTITCIIEALRADQGRAAVSRHGPSIFCVHCKRWGASVIESGRLYCRHCDHDYGEAI